MHRSRLKSRTGCDRSCCSLAKQSEYYTFLNINSLSYVYIYKHNGKNTIIMNSKSVELIKKYTKLSSPGYQLKHDMATVPVEDNEIRI